MLAVLLLALECTSGGGAADLGFVALELGAAIVGCDAMRCDAMQCNVMQCSTVRYGISSLALALGWQQWHSLFVFGTAELELDLDLKLELNPTPNLNLNLN